MFCVDIFVSVLSATLGYNSGSLSYLQEVLLSWFTNRILHCLMFSIFLILYRNVKVKLSLCLTNQALRHEGVWGSWFLTSALVGGEWSASRPCRFTPGKRVPDTHWLGGCVDPRVGLDDLEKRKFLTLPGLKLRSLGRPARSQSLYRLCYPGSWLSIVAA
jgi:hypothetical protein